MEQTKQIAWQEQFILKWRTLNTERGFIVKEIINYIPEYNIDRDLVLDFISSLLQAKIKEIEREKKEITEQDYGWKDEEISFNSGLDCTISILKK